MDETNNIMTRTLSNVLGSRNSESSEHILHIRTVTEIMLRKLVEVTDAYHLTEAEISFITTLQPRLLQSQQSSDTVSSHWKGGSCPLYPYQ